MEDEQRKKKRIEKFGLSTTELSEEVILTTRLQELPSLMFLLLFNCRIGRRKGLKNLVHNSLPHTVLILTDHTTAVPHIYSMLNFVQCRTHSLLCSCDQYIASLHKINFYDGSIVMESDTHSTYSMVFSWRWLVLNKVVEISVEFSCRTGQACWSG